MDSVPRPQDSGCGVRHFFCVELCAASLTVLNFGQFFFVNGWFQFGFENDLKQ